MSAHGGVIVDAQNVGRMFAMPAGPVHAVRDVTLQIRAGDHIAVRGPSGCGKSTLLHMLGCVDAPSSGTLLFDGQDVSRLSDSKRSALRLKRIGFIFQRFFLLPMLTAAENVELPLSEAGASKRDRMQRTKALLEYVGLSARADHRPSQLSGGEMQRVAIARALANRPRLLLADEPTGELDQATGEQIGALLDRLHADGTAVVVVTHDSGVASRARRLIRMRDWRIVEEQTRCSSRWRCGRSSRAPSAAQCSPAASGWVWP
jgi:putative ABC transport system ATP-binding protein